MIVANLCYSCQICTCKTITCPAFTDEKFDLWFPYVNDQVLIFKDRNGIADTIIIKNIMRTEQYEGRTGGGYGCGKGCNSSITIYGVQSANTEIGKLSIGANKFNITDNSQSLFSNVFLSLKNTSFTASSISDTGFVNSENSQPFFTSKFQTSLLIGSKMFSNVQLIQIDTMVNKPAGAYKLFFSRSNGLVAWENYSDKSLWIKD